MRITSTANPRVRHAVRLRKHRTRRRTGLFLVEGFREIRRALDAGADMVELWTSPDLYLGENEGELVERARRAGTRVTETSERVFRTLSYRDRPEGLMAVCRQFDTSLARLVLGPRPLVLVAESIEKPGNLGTMIRTAAAAGCDAVVVADETTDVFNPNVVRASLGTLFTVPIAVAGAAEVIEWARRHDLRLCAATPTGHTLLWDAPLPTRLALLVGSEQYGLSPRFLEAADLSVRIPMPGGRIDSLNAATAASLLVYEALRQRAAG